MGTSSANTFEFAVQFENPDGSLFILNPEGDWPEGALPQSAFHYTVVKTEDGFFRAGTPHLCALMAEVAKRVRHECQSK